MKGDLFPLEVCYSSQRRDLSDKTLTGLTKFIRQQLLPESFVDGNDETFPSTIDLLPLSIVENAIQSVAERVNYGVEPNQLGNAASKVPAALCMWRWEVKDHASFPKQIRDKIESRRLERVAAKMELVIILDALTADQKLVLAGNKVTGTNNLATAIQRQPSTDCPLEIGKEVSSLYRSLGIALTNVQYTEYRGCHTTERISRAVERHPQSKSTTYDLSRI
jgi:hypothetical protein